MAVCGISEPLGAATEASCPMGSRARVLLTSVFGPYARDDEFGRVMNPMELYQNQVTRVQGPFSLRMFHRSWGIMLIQANISAPCRVLDFPLLERFISEIRDHHYDVVGITSIPPNLARVRKMCELIRKYLPRATIVIGGHIGNMPGLDERIDADHIVKGEGVRWFRRFLGEDEDQPINHPVTLSGIGTRSVGITLKEKFGDVAATLIPSVGCPLGCNFCSTSAMFGGKGKHINFYETGDDIFEIMCTLERELGVYSFFVMDENFLLQRKRTLRLLDLMEEHNKAWALYVFSSANVLRNYTIDQLVRLGISWVWMGLEGEDSQYTKLHGMEPKALIREFQSHGIRVLGSTIIGLENHTPENIDEAIEYAAAFDTDFHQFMLYTPIPGTPLHAEMTAQGRMKDESEYDLADVHGQYIFSFNHLAIKDDLEAELLERAFTHDFEVNGPSTIRIARTTLTGWKRYKNHPDARIRRRFAREAADLGVTYSAVVSAAKRFYRKDPPMRTKMAALLKDLHREFGLKSRFASALGGLYVHWTMRREAKRLAAGWTYEPPTFYESNAGFIERDGKDPAGAVPCRIAVPPLGEHARCVPGPVAS